ncbi:MAG: hypothetical protein JXR35_11255 [Rhodobacteraceae bacterium]|nr:hypothetical protein [Paracoccaceae bacterium]
MERPENAIEIPRKSEPPAEHICRQFLFLLDRGNQINGVIGLDRILGVHISAALQLS